MIGIAIDIQNHVLVCISHNPPLSKDGKLLKRQGAIFDL